MIKTRAVLIGIERYAAGETWNLDGPAADACRFAQWLLDEGVPSKQITVIAEPLPQNRAEVEALGLRTLAADQATVHRFFADDLRGESSELLLVLWGGHGVVDGEGSRRLFYSDATVHNKQNADFNSLMGSLATTYFPGHPHQVFLVDACQNLTSELKFVNSLPHQAFSKGDFMYGRRQHALFAASAGEAAINDNLRRTGLFSSEVLAWLEAAKPAWPPDIPAMAAALETRFADHRASGSTLQTPSYLWLKTPTSEGLIRSRPSVPSRPGRLSLSGMRAVVDVLVTIPEIVDTANRQKLILMMPEPIPAAVSYDGVPHRHITSWLRECVKIPDGRAEFIETLKLGILDPRDLQRALETIDMHWQGS